MGKAFNFLFYVHYLIFGLIYFSACAVHLVELASSKIVCWRGDRAIAWQPERTCFGRRAEEMSPVPFISLLKQGEREFAILSRSVPISASPFYGHSLREWENGEHFKCLACHGQFTGLPTQNIFH